MKKSEKEPQFVLTTTENFRAEKSYQLELELDSPGTKSAHERYCDCVVKICTLPLNKSCVEMKLSLGARNQGLMREFSKYHA